MRGTLNAGSLAIRLTIGADGLSGSVNEKLRGRGKRSEMNLKFWKKENQDNDPPGIAKVEAQYMAALADLCLLAREERIKKLVAYMMPKSHIHKNGKRKPKGVKRNPYPSGNDL